LPGSGAGSAPAGSDVKNDAKALKEAAIPNELVQVENVLFACEQLLQTMSYQCS
jgi:hypothetical protein